MAILLIKIAAAQNDVTLGYRRVHPGAAQNDVALSYQRVHPGAAQNDVTLGYQRVHLGVAQNEVTLGYRRVHPGAQAIFSCSYICGHYRNNYTYTSVRLMPDER